MSRNSKEIRQSIEERWKEYLSRYGNLFSSNSLSGSSPPSVFVGSYNYPKVGVGPMVPPIHGDTSILDIPEKWVGKSLEEIVNFRLSLVRGIQKVSVKDSETRFIENLQEVAMSSKPTDTDLEFHKKTIPVSTIDGESAPFGPIGEIKSAKFSGLSAKKIIEDAYYDRDLKAEDAILKLYNSGIDLSQIQKCFSIGMFGKKRKLVPTRWSITATDDIISKSLILDILEYQLIDCCKVFSFDHLGNMFSVILFPHRWLFEMEEAWYDEQGQIGFGTDFEDARGIDHPPAIAGAYFAAKLGVVEYLSRNKIQAAVLVLREIRPEYAVPVGVWQVREGIRETMKQNPFIASNLDEGLNHACKSLSISKLEWLSKGELIKKMKQKSITDFL
jgi:DNA repair protein NreA